MQIRFDNKIQNQNYKSAMADSKAPKQNDTNDAVVDRASAVKAIRKEMEEQGNAMAFKILNDMGHSLAGKGYKMFHNLTVKPGTKAYVSNQPLINDMLEEVIPKLVAHALEEKEKDAKDSVNAKIHGGCLIVKDFVIECVMDEAQGIFQIRPVFSGGWFKEGIALDPSFYLYSCNDKFVKWC